MGIGAAPVSADTKIFLISVLMPIKIGQKILMTKESAMHIESAAAVIIELGPAYYVDGKEMREIVVRLL